MTDDTSLYDLHLAHHGKVSDKWELYLRIYDRAFNEYRRRNISLLEIGIQNGGSLDVWAKYFPVAERIIGCDINPKCRDLSFADRRIATIVSDINLPETQRLVAQHSAAYDIIIDDGSHRSPDIVGTFIRYYDMLKPGGVFAVEDLHCSYWVKWGGGINTNDSAMAFFKALVDLVNFDHWKPGTPYRTTPRLSRQPSIAKMFAPFLKGSTTPKWLGEKAIESIEVHDSLVLIRKPLKADGGRLGRRIIVGEDAIVSKAPVEYREKHSTGI